mmetsp:Transcript_21306/g.41775  ORF Transcript_21306/g.41775 Transcript_21306/m.41775 type:complete len:89 (-) Transcript_21306:40-306(-)
MGVMAGVRRSSFSRTQARRNCCVTPKIRSPSQASELLSAYITTNSAELRCIACVDGDGGADFLKTVDEGEGEKAQGHFTSLARSGMAQ